MGSIQSTSRLTTTQLDPTTSATSNQLDDLRNQLALERSIAVGAENLLHVFETDTEGTEELRNQVEEELQAANARIAHLVSLLTEAEGASGVYTQDSRGNEGANWCLCNYR
mgnify:FL=1